MFYGPEVGANSEVLDLRQVRAWHIPPSSLPVCLCMSLSLPLFLPLCLAGSSHFLLLRALPRWLLCVTVGFAPLVLLFLPVSLRWRASTNLQLLFENKSLRGSFETKT